MSKLTEKPTAVHDDLPTSGHDTPSGAHNNTETPTEIGGRDGPDPTRFGDWEKAGRCIDF